MNTIRSAEITKRHVEDVQANITLSETGTVRTPWVTHFQNVEDARRSGNPEGGKSVGHYFEREVEAIEDFHFRLARGY